MRGSLQRLHPRSRWRGWESGSADVDLAGRRKQDDLAADTSESTTKPLAVDCRVSGDAVTCTSNRQEQLPNGTGTYSETGEVTATLSGLTMTGTVKRHGTSEGVEGCVSKQELSGPVTYVFSLDGTVAMREGPLQQEIVFSGVCANSPPISSTGPVWEGTGTWSAIE